MLRVGFTGFLMVALAASAQSIAMAATMTQTVNATFGAGDPGGDGDLGSEFFALTFSLPAISSFDSIGLQLAHGYGSDVEIQLDAPGVAGSLMVVVGDDPIVGNGHDDDTMLGDGAGILVANVVDYTLDPTASGPFMDHVFGGVLASGSYTPDAWVAGAFPAGDWVVRIWDTWDANDPGAVGDVSVSYTVAPVPEPTSIGLAVLAMGGILGLWRRNS